MMIAMGFFQRTGKRYQMTVPDQLNIEAVRSAALQMTHTLNSNYLPHPSAKDALKNAITNFGRKIDLVNIGWQATG
jgi:hypothetical protein